MNTTTRSSSASTLSCLAFAGAALVHLVGLYLPRVEVPGPIDVPGADKAVHVLLFAVVMLTGALARIPARWLALVLGVHAVVSEVIQHLVLPGRSGDAFDVVANLGGVALGWYLASMIGRHRTTTH